METAKAAGAAITLAAINFAASIPSVPNKSVGWNKRAGWKKRVGWNKGVGLNKQAGGKKSFLFIVEK